MGELQVNRVFFLTIVLTFSDDSGMGAFAAKLLNIPKTDDGSNMSMPPMPPTGMAEGNIDQNMIMQGGPGFFQMGGMGPMMGMMGPGPNAEMMNMSNMGNMMMFPGVSTLWLKLCIFLYHYVSSEHFLTQRTEKVVNLFKRYVTE